MYRFLLGCMCSLVFGGLIGRVSAFSVEEIPVSPNAYVVDMADLFSDEEEADLNIRIREIQTAFSHEIGVLTIPTLGPYEISQLSVEVAQERGVGQKNLDNGILLLIAEEERQWRIEVGYGLEDELPDILAKQLGDEYLVPSFRQGDYAGGVGELVTVFSGVFAGSFHVGPYEGAVLQEGGLFLLFLIGVFVAIGVGGTLRPMLKDREKLFASGLGTVGITSIGGLIIGSVAWTLFLPFLIIRLLVLFANFRMTPGRGGRDSGRHGSWSSTSFGGSFGGGFGGFGGGSFGGGGASGSW